MAEVVLEHISKEFPGGVQAVRDFNLSVSDGELVVLVGPSGSGKSTTLRIIAGLEVPTTGSVFIGGKDVTALSPRARRVAMVFQRPALYPHLNVRRNLQFGVEMREDGNWWHRLGAYWPGVRRVEQKRALEDRVAQTAQLIGLTDLLGRLPRQLSGGEQQRVALGRAIIRQPEVFLLDEPLSHLDGRLRAELRHELHLLQRRLRATMFYVTHDQAEAMTLADRLVVMDQGVVQQVNRPLTVYEEPCSRFVASFLGWPAMNFIDGRLLQVDGGLCFAASVWTWKLPTGLSDVWRGFAGKEVTLGIRPEDILLFGPTGCETRLAMEVALIESLGPETLVTFQRGGCQLTARLYDRENTVSVLSKEPRTIVEVYFHMDRAHLFDRSTGLALNHYRSTG